MKFGKDVRLVAVAALTVLSIVACADDPTDEGSGDPFAIVTSVSTAVRAVGSAFTVTASVVDRQGTPLPTPVSASSLKTDVIVIDSMPFIPELQETRLYMRAIKVDASAPIVFTAGVLTDTVRITVQ